MAPLCVYLGIVADASIYTSGTVKVGYAKIELPSRSFTVSDLK